MASHEFTDKRRPLSPNTRRLVLEQLEKMSFVHEFSVLLYLYTGAERIDGSHLQQKMVSETQRGLQVQFLPGEHQCRSGGYRGKNPDWGLGEPCQYCEDVGTYSFSDPRLVPVRDERAVGVISQWFQLYDYTPSSGTMAKYIKQTGVEAGVPRLSPSVLRHSFGVILAGKGFNQDEISDVMGRNRSNPEYDLVFQTYGELCEGGNPYRCESPTVSGEPCKKLTRPGELCDYHSPDSGCKAITASNEPCGRRVVTADGLCSHHANSTHRCGEKTANGSTCDATVWSSEECCVFHRDSQPVCGGDTRDGGQCRRPVEEEGLRCPMHSDYICGEDDIQRDGVCRRSVQAPDGVCRYHADSTYICGAEGGCQLPVLDPGSRCFVHQESQPTCGAENRYGEPCMRIVDSPDARCSYHSDGVGICGAETEDGVCNQVVTVSNSRCRVHSDSWYKCGAEKTRGGFCQRPVDEPVEKCQFHSGYQCGADNKFGEPCQQYVDSPDEFCQYHNES